MDNNHCVQAAINSNSMNLIRTLGLETIAKRYELVQSIGDSFGGASFIGQDNLTNEKVFVKYLICHRGEADRAKFLMERDALVALEKFPGKKIAPKLLHFEEFQEILSAVLVTEFVNGESLSNWLKRSEKVDIDEKLAVFHRIVVALSRGTLLFRHRDIHPGNIFLMPPSNVMMGPDFSEYDVDPGVRIIDWGESLPVIFGNYDDEPDHNFVLFDAAPNLLGGSITSLPPEVFSPWRRNADFGGLYESWGLGLLPNKILLDEPPPRAESIGHYVQKIGDGSLQEWIDEQVVRLVKIGLPGGSIIPSLIDCMLKISPDSRFSLSRVGRILWDVRFEQLSISNQVILDSYMSNPNDFQPLCGWKYSSRPDFD